MPEANLFLLFTRRLNTLGVRYTYADPTWFPDMSPELRAMLARVTKGALEGNAGQPAREVFKINGQYVNTPAQGVVGTPFFDEYVEKALCVRLLDLSQRHDDREGARAEVSLTFAVRGGSMSFKICRRTGPVGRMLAGLLALTAALALSLTHHAQEARAADESETELAKKTQNPIADLISVPFQSNFNFNTGTKDATVYILNVQPVIPFKLSEDWNLITRTITPIINQPSLFPGWRAPSAWATSTPRSSSHRPSPAPSSGP